jgi:SAM-dependent methyltransferase
MTNTLPDLYGDLVAYTGREPQLVRARCETAIVELAWLWAQYRDNPTAYYTATDLYLFDLTKYQSELRRLGVARAWAESVCNVREAAGGCRVLDYGGGIGEWALIAALNGADVTYFDLDGPTLAYARWRFERHNAPVRVLTSDPLGERYDVIVAMDVLEHLPEPQPVIERLAASAPYLYCNPGEVRYDWLYPQHISRYDPRPQFERQGGYIWRRAQ